jgi:N-acetylglucosaminyldiphosphoundecaprenol N-acetyl-beta-D-mannosaminyltransferase
VKISSVPGEGSSPDSEARPASDTQLVRTLSCAGIPIGQLSQHEANAFLIECALSGPASPMDVHLCNAYTIALADRSEKLRKVLNGSGLNLPDGMSVFWANRFFHRGPDRPNARVRGTDLLLDTFERGNEHELRHYLLGSTPEVLSSMYTNLLVRFPGVEIVGRESPPFRELTESEREEQLQRISISGAQIVWVGLGTPKQDIEAAKLARRLPLVVVAVGAAFDFVAGNKKQAPTWMQRTGLEWLYRLMSEPRRLWRRYLFGNVRFLWALFRRLQDPEQWSACP